MKYEERTLTIHGEAREAIFVSWDDIEAHLGRKHDGSPEDDDSIITELLILGAPIGAALEREGIIDGQGWYLLSF
jgi:hypothetical protein